MRLNYENDKTLHNTKKTQTRKRDKLQNIITLILEN